MKRLALLLLFASPAWSQPASEYFKTVILCTGVGCGSGECVYQLGDETPQLQVCNASGLAFDVTGGVVTLTSADPSIIFDSLNTDFWISAKGVDVFQIGKGTTPGTTPFLTIDDGGDVGIGTESPFAVVHILGGGSSFDTGNANQMLVVQNTASTSNGSILSVISGNAGTAQLTFGDVDEAFESQIVHRQADNRLDIRVELSDHTTFAADGTVGIGTTGPSSRLDLDGTGITTIEIDGSGGGCLATRDTDDAGWTCSTTLNGVRSDFCCLDPSTCVVCP